jgi:hypothetical protein
MVKWVKEIVLQRYWAERCGADEYTLEGRRILSARRNPRTDAFPDIIANRVEGLGREVPAEVEWTTDDFRHHNHPVDFLKANDGFLIVWRETHDFPVPQVPIEKPKFQAWLGENYGQLLTDTLVEVEQRVEQSLQPRIWIIYMSKTVERNLDIGLENGIWGFPGRSGVTHQMYAQAVKKGDIVVFAGPWEWGPSTGPHTGGRVALSIFQRGRFGRIVAFAVTRGYYEDSTIVWPPREGEVWKHRIGIRKAPLFDAINVSSSVSSLGRSLPELLRNAMVGRSDRPVEVPSTLLPSLLKGVGQGRR